MRARGEDTVCCDTDTSAEHSLFGWAAAELELFSSMCVI